MFLVHLLIDHSLRSMAAAYVYHLARPTKIAMLRRLDRSGFVDHRRIRLLNIAVGQTPKELFILTQRNKNSKIKRFYLPQAISSLRKAFYSRENENFFQRHNVNKTKGYAFMTSLISVAGVMHVRRSKS